MSGWGKRLKGILGLSVIGGAIGSAYGVVRLGLMALLGMGGLTTTNLLGAVAVYGAFAALATGGVGVLLTTVGRRLSLHELSPWKAALFGAVLGAGAPLLLIGATYTGVQTGAVLAAIGLRFGLMGGLLGGGFVAAAQWADRNALDAPDEATLIGRGEAG
ncbi:MAG: hypothetical protein AAF389_00085 [Gemmatimonadota bacterium]